MYSSINIIKKLDFTKLSFTGFMFDSLTLFSDRLFRRRATSFRLLRASALKQRRVTDAGALCKAALLLLPNTVKARQKSKQLREILRKSQKDENYVTLHCRKETTY